MQTFRHDKSWSEYALQCQSAVDSSGVNVYWEGSESPVNTEIHQSEAFPFSNGEFSRENFAGVSHHSICSNLLMVH
jgi:hypothetical protein